MHEASQKERERHEKMQEAECSVQTAHSHDDTSDKVYEPHTSEAAKPGVAGVRVAGTGVVGAGEPDTGAGVGDWGGAAEEGTEGGGEDTGDPATHGMSNSSIITFSKFLINDSTLGSLSSADADLSTHDDST
ncbi:hypothetical protein BDBG_17318 [Blastomyces gilchristii SLH14081]|uniref:Uncharacterized protein n=1 Tax=Blastomyces gilchristii (strain SLH14081) TaxID=559298 RepID=A0A179UQ66_BLAGS|nr:uncharacterized protein BDBG_17318 [Blastomyces gilchristii SLH14081]OAT10154.1 hypothetical protein BDBG_17318 [Blastomyces gilchristii SLH14081]